MRIEGGVNHLLTIRQANFETKQTEAAKAAAPTEEPIAQTLKIDDLKIELGYALLPLVNAAGGSDRLTE